MELPGTLSALVGRDRELREVAKLLAREDVRLVTLTGPGGVGKTRLAIAAAAEDPRRVRFVDLSAVRDAASVTATIASRLGVREPQLARTLAREPTLLVADNLEQIPDAGLAVRELLGAVPGLAILATSRVPLRVDGEHRHTVQPLALPPDGVSGGELERFGATALFCDRAAAADPAFVPVPAVAEICRLMDGLPLAIELAAARCSVLTPDQIAERMDSLPGLLSSRRIDVRERHATMRAAVDWSIDLLAPGERELLAALSVFASAASLEAIEHVAGRSIGELLEPLSALVDQSLVVRDGDARYRLLRSVRARATGLASGDRFRIRHRDLVAAMVRGLAEHDVLGLAHMLDEVREAISFMAGRPEDASLYVEIAGHVAMSADSIGAADEARRWLTSALESAPARTHDRARALVAASRLAADLDAGEAALTEALAIEEEIGHEPCVAGIWNALGNVANRRGRLDDARAWYERALGADRAAGREDRVGKVLGNLATVVGGTDPEAGLRLREEALATARRTGDVRGMCSALINLGTAAGSLHRFQEAIRYLEESHAIARRVGFREDEALILGNLAEAHRLAGDLSTARARIGAAVAAAEASGDDASIAEALLGSALVAADDGASVRARDLAWDALLRFRAIGEEPGADRCIALLEELAAPRSATLRREGRTWTVIFAGTTASVRNTRGMHAIARLVRAPGSEVHCSDLVAAWRGHAVRARGDLGEVLDPVAREAYRARTAALQEELAEAEAWNDIERAERLRDEIEAIRRELARALGLRGKPRVAGSTSERDRVNVARAIDQALVNVAVGCAAAADHLREAIRTGTFCSYTPATPVRWEL